MVSKLTNRGNEFYRDTLNTNYNLFLYSNNLLKPCYKTAHYTDNQSVSVVKDPNSILVDRFIITDNITENTTTSYASLYQEFKPGDSLIDSKLFTFNYINFSLYILKDNIPRTTRFASIRIKRNRLYDFSTYGSEDTIYVDIDTETGEIHSGTHSPSGYYPPTILSSTSTLETLEGEEYYRVSLVGKLNPYFAEGYSFHIYPCMGAGSSWNFNTVYTGSITVCKLQLNEFTTTTPYLTDTLNSYMYGSISQGIVDYDLELLNNINNSYLKDFCIKTIDKSEKYIEIYNTSIPVHTANYNTTSNGLVLSNQTITTPATTNYDCLLLVGSAGVMLKVGTTTGAYTTNGGATWTAVTLPNTEYWAYLHHNGTNFILLASNADGTGAGKTIAYSPTGATWTSVVLTNPYVQLSYIGNPRDSKATITSNGTILLYDVAATPTLRTSTNNGTSYSSVAIATLVSDPNAKAFKLVAGLNGLVILFIITGAYPNYYIGYHISTNHGASFGSYNNLYGIGSSLSGVGTTVEYRLLNNTYLVCFGDIGTRIFDINNGTLLNTIDNSSLLVLGVEYFNNKYVILAYDNVSPHSYYFKSTDSLTSINLSNPIYLPTNLYPGHSAYYNVLNIKNINNKLFIIPIECYDFNSVSVISSLDDIRDIGSINMLPLNGAYFFTSFYINNYRNLIIDYSTSLSKYIVPSRFNTTTNTWLTIQDDNDESITETNTIVSTSNSNLSIKLPSIQGTYYIYFNKNINNLSYDTNIFYNYSYILLYEVDVHSDYTGNTFISNILDMRSTTLNTLPNNSVTNSSVVAAYNSDKSYEILNVPGTYTVNPPTTAMFARITVTGSTGGYGANDATNTFGGGGGGGPAHISNILWDATPIRIVIGAVGTPGLVAGAAGTVGGTTTITHLISNTILTVLGGGGGAGATGSAHGTGGAGAAVPAAPFVAGATAYAGGTGGTGGNGNGGAAGWAYPGMSGVYGKNGCLGQVSSDAWVLIEWIY